MCTDTMLMQHAWWVKMPVGLCLAFVADGLLGLVLRKSARHRGGTWWPGLLVAPIVSVVLALGSMVVAHALLALFLLVRFAVVVHRTAPELRWIRGAVVASIVFSFSVSSLPSNRPTNELIRLARHGGGSQWLEEELRHRPEALSLVEAAMMPKRVDAGLLRLHYALGGERAARNSMCSFDRTNEVCLRDELSRE